MKHWKFIYYNHLQMNHILALNDSFGFDKITLDRLTFKITLDRFAIKINHSTAWLTMSRMRDKVKFKWSKTGLNWIEFSFSTTGCLIRTNESSLPNYLAIDRKGETFMPFPKGISVKWNVNSFLHFLFLSWGIILLIELPWPDNPANTYARHTKTLESCFDLFRFDLQWWRSRETTLSKI